MRNCLWKKGLVFGIIFVFIGASIVPATCIINENDNIIKNQIQIESKIGYDSNSIDDYEWPKHHYDLNNSGFSPSPHAPETNNIIWTYTTNFDVGGSPAVVNGKVYIGSDDEYFYCLNAFTGDKIWDYPIPGGTYLCSPCVMGGKVYLGAVYDYIYCWDAETGEMIWKFYKGYSICSSPAVVDGKVYIGVAGTENKRIYCLDADTGDIVWDYNHSDLGVSEPAVVNGKVYIGTGDVDGGIIFCFDADTGDILWNFTTDWYAMGGPAVVDGKVYSSGSGMHCLDAETGDELWNFPDGNTTITPAVAYDRIYFKTRFGATKIYCLDAGTGNELWNYPLSGDDLGGSSPAIADGKMYISISSFGKLFCLDAYTGELIWNYNIAQGLSSPAVAYGNVYIGGGYSPVVYCFGDPSQPPDAPTIDGKTNGKAGKEYEYSFNSTDPDGDTLRYYVDWGDDDAGWSEYSDSGEEITLKHTWGDEGTFNITAKAQDINGAESNWSEFKVEIEIPRNRVLVSFNLLNWFLERFPLLEKLLTFIRVF